MRRVELGCEHCEEAYELVRPAEIVCLQPSRFHPLAAAIPPRAGRIALVSAVVSGYHAMCVCVLCVSVCVCVCLCLCFQIIHAF